MDSPPLRVVIVDDETHGREKLQRYLADAPGFACVGQAADGLTAVELIEETRPDLVFLDIQMPGLDGFDVVEALAFDPLPRIVFVTAHDTHAVRAFEVHALDYLLKPVDRERFAEALDRAREAVPVAVQPAAAHVAHEVAPRRAPLTRFLVRSRGRMHLVAIDDVDWIGAAGNYAELHVGRDTHLVRGTLTGLEARLPADRFARIHRSTIVHLDRIESLHPWSHGDMEVVLRGGTRLRLSRRYRAALEAMFGP